MKKYLAPHYLPSLTSSTYKHKNQSPQTHTHAPVHVRSGPPEDQCDWGGSKGPFIGGFAKNKTFGGGGSAGKITSWEGGHREVGVFRWPGKIAPGSVSHALTSTMVRALLFDMICNVSWLIFMRWLRRYLLTCTHMRTNIQRSCCI